MGARKQTATNFENQEFAENECGEVYAINVLGGRWKLMICCMLRNGKLRYSELKRKIPNISERMLTLQLREMENDMLVCRTVYPEIPPKVEYELTESANKLTPIWEFLRNWSDEHRLILRCKKNLEATETNK